MPEHPNLSPVAIEQIARRVAELLKEGGVAGSRRFVDAATLAAELGVERDWVYAHAKELGALRLGGPNGRLRFDLPAVVGRLRSDELPPPRRPHRRSARAMEKQPPKTRPQRRLRSLQIQRRASGDAPTRSPKQHRPGGNPDDEA